MKTFIKCFLPALALMAFACTGAEKQTGKSFDELPALPAEQLWKGFAAIPQADLPEKVKSPDYRINFRERMEEMQDGFMGDGEGETEGWYSSENSIYWSDYFTLPEDYDWAAETSETTHPFTSFNGYMNPDGTRMYIALKVGAYNGEGEEKSEYKYYWYDIASGKVTPSKLLIDKPYTPDDLAEDTLLHYGANALYYSLKEGNYYPFFYDRGLEVYIEDVGDSGLRYEWDGTQFVKVERKHIYALYGFGFSNIMLRERMPFDIPGYQTVRIESDNEYEFIYEIRKDGESDPTLVFHANQDLDLVDIEICTDRYANVYGIYPGMPYQDFMDIVNEYNSYFEEEPYLSVVADMDDRFAYIFWGFDEDYYYLVDKKYIKGDKVAPNAKIARVGATSAVG